MDIDTIMRKLGNCSNSYVKYETNYGSKGIAFLQPTPHGTYKLIHHGDKGKKIELHANEFKDCEPAERPTLY